MANHQARTFDVKPAVREAVNLKVGLFAPSGGGKTFSALRIAAGIQSVTGGDIAFVDTENRRALHYAEWFKFHHLDFKPPHGSLDYLEAIKAAAKVGRIVIVDSMSHEHEGVGGMIDYHEAEVDRLAGGADAAWSKKESVNMLAWAKPKAARRHLLNAGVIGVDAHLILCFRAKNTAKPVFKQDDQGRRKTEVVQLGYMPIAGEEFIFEMDLAALLLPGAAGVPTWSSDNPGEKMMIKVPEQFARLKKDKDLVLDEKLGENLAIWARGSAEEKAPAKSAAEKAKPADQEKPADPPKTAAKPKAGAGSTGEFGEAIDVAADDVTSYVLAGEGPRGDGRWVVYQAGKPVATIGENKLKAYPVAKRHWVAPQEPQEPAAAEDGPNISTTPEDRQDGTQEGAADQSSTTPPAEEPEDSGTVPIDQAFRTFAGEVAEADTWPPIRAAIQALTNTDTFRNADPTMRSRSRAMAYFRLEELNRESLEAGNGMVCDFLDDPQAFRCYLEAEGEADAIVGNLRAFKASRVGMGLAPAALAAFDQAAKTRLAELASVSSNAGEFA